MKFILNDDNLEIKQIENINAGSINYYVIDVEYNSAWDNLSIYGILVRKEGSKTENAGISIPLIDNKIYIDNKINGLYGIGFIGYTIENEEKIYQISTNLENINFSQGAGEISTINTDIPTPTQWEIYISQIQDMIDSLEDLLDEKVDKVEGKGLSTNDFTDIYKENVDSNTSARHTHSNKAVLDEISANDISNWNGKSDFSGSYNDLTNKPTIPDELSDLSDDSTHRLVTDTEKLTWSGKQDALVSGTNIKTINNESILGSGNIDIQGGGDDDDARSAILSLVSDLTDTMSYNAPAVAKGSSLTLNDTAELGLSDLRIHGKTVQNGTPSPTNPVPIENVKGINIFDGIIENGGFYSDGTNVSHNQRTRSKDYIPVIPNTSYTISLWKNNTGKTIQVSISYYSINDYTTARLSVSSWEELSYTFTTPSNCNYIRFLLRYSNDSNMTISDGFGDVLIENGNRASSSFIAYNTIKIKRANAEGTGHEEQTYLFPLGDSPLMAGDWIDSYGVHHVKGQKIFNGSEDWSLLNSTSSRTALYTIVNDIEGYSSGSDIPRLISSYFVPVSNDATWQSGMVSRHQGSANQKNVYFIIGGNETVSSFTTWLSSHPTTLEYYLATPTLTAFTDEQRQVYDTILKDGTYEVVTNYTTEGNLAPEIEVTYQKDLATKFESIQDEIEEILGE